MTDYDNDEESDINSKDEENIKFIEEEIIEKKLPDLNKSKKRKPDTELKDLDDRPTKKKKIQKEKKPTKKNLLKEEILNTYNSHMLSNVKFSTLSLNDILNSYLLSTSGRNDSQFSNSELNKIIKDFSNKIHKSITTVSVNEEIKDENGEKVLDEKGNPKKKRRRSVKFNIAETEFIKNRNPDLNLLQAELWIDQCCFLPDSQRYVPNVIKYKSLPLPIQESVIDIGFRKYGMDVNELKKIIDIPLGIRKLKEALESLKPMGINNININFNGLQNNV